MNYKLIAALALALCVLLALRSIFKRSESTASLLNLDDLLLGDDNKMSKAAAVMFGSFLVTTWVVIVLTLRDKMDGVILGVYVTAWVAPTVTRLIVNRPSDPPVAVAETQTISTTKTTTPTGGVS